MKGQVGKSESRVRVRPWAVQRGGVEIQGPRAGTSSACRRIRKRRDARDISPRRGSGGLRWRATRSIVGTNDAREHG